MLEKLVDPVLAKVVCFIQMPEFYSIRARCIQRDRLSS